MKKKIIFLSILLLSLFLVNNKNFVIKNKEKMATLFLDEKQEAIAQIANMYYSRKSNIQYDLKKMDINGDTSIATNRRQSNVSPDEISKYNKVYLDCSSFVYNVYREAFDYDLSNILTSGSKTFSGFTTNNLSKISSSAKVYRYDYDTDFTSKDIKKELTDKIKSTLKTGDLLVTRKSDSGHVMLYVEENNKGYLIHATGNSYDYNKKTDNEEKSGAIQKTPLNTILTNASDKHYLFPSDKSLESLTIIRPLNVISSDLSDKARKLGLSNYINIQKYSTVNASVGTQKDDILTYKIYIKNTSKGKTNVNINFPAPSNTTFTSQGKSSFTLSKNGSKTITYKVKVNSNGVNVVDNGVTVNGISLKPITFVSNNKLSNSELSKLRTTASKYKNTNVVYANTAFSTIDSVPSKTNKLSLNNGKLISSIYYNALNQNINIDGGSQVFNSLFTSNGSTYTLKKDSSAISNMLVNNMYGGTRVQTTNNDDKLNRTRYLSFDNLVTGDILFELNGSTDELYLYLDKYFITVDQASGYVKNTTSNSNKIIEKALGSDAFAVLRPSYVLNSTTPPSSNTNTNNSTDNSSSSSNNKVIENKTLNADQEKTFLDTVEKFEKRINNKSITFSIKKGELGKYPEKAKYLNSSSLIYNIYYSAFKINLPSTSSKYFTSKYNNVIDNYSQISSLQTGDVLVYIYGSNNGVTGLYLGNNKILRYKESGLSYQTIDEFKAECQTRPISKFGVFRPVNTKELKSRDDKYVSVTDISCNNSYTVNKKEYVTLDVTVNPSDATNKKLTFKSSNKKVATVTSAGKVKGVSAGTATITITSKDSIGISKDVAITVNDSSSSTSSNNNSGSSNNSSSNSSSTVKFNSSSYTLLEGHSITITPNINGNIDSFTYSTSKSGYIETTPSSDYKTVLVNGLKVGSTKLTIVLDNGKKASTTIKVKQNSENRSVSFQSTSYSIGIGKTKTLTPTTKIGYNSGITFTSDNPDCLSVQTTSSNRSVIIQGKSKCTTYITASLSDGSSHKVKVKVS